MKSQQSAQIREKFLYLMKNGHYNVNTNPSSHKNNISQTELKFS